MCHSVCRYVYLGDLSNRNNHFVQWLDKCLLVSKNAYQYSAVSRAILKSVYWFGISNSNPQMLKSVDSWCKLSSTFLVAEPREQCFELFRMQNSQKFPVFCPWNPLRRAQSTAPDSPAAQQFFSLLCLLINQHPQKIAGYSTAVRTLANYH